MSDLYRRDILLCIGDRTGIGNRHNCFVPICGMFSILILHVILPDATILSSVCYVFQRWCLNQQEMRILFMLTSVKLHFPVDQRIFRKWWSSRFNCEDRILQSLLKHSVDICDSKIFMRVTKSPQCAFRMIQNYCEWNGSSSCIRPRTQVGQYDVWFLFPLWGFSFHRNVYVVTQRFD